MNPDQIKLFALVIYIAVGIIFLLIFFKNADPNSPLHPADREVTALFLSCIWPLSIVLFGCMMAEFAYEKYVTDRMTRRDLLNKIYWLEKSNEAIREECRRAKEELRDQLNEPY